MGPFLRSSIPEIGCLEFWNCFYSSLQPLAWSSMCRFSAGGLQRLPEVTPIPFPPSIFAPELLGSNKWWEELFSAMVSALLNCSDLPFKISHINIMRTLSEVLPCLPRDQRAKTVNPPWRAEMTTWYWISEDSSIIFLHLEALLKELYHWPLNCA